MPMVYKWLILAALMVASGVAGYVHGLRYQQGIEAQGKLAVEREHNKLLSRVLEQGRAQTAVVQRNLDRERADKVKQQAEFERKLADAPRGSLTEVSCPDQPAGGAATAQPRPALAPAATARLSATGCGMWNDALAAGFTATERAGATAGDHPCAGPVEIDDALRNLRVNADLLGQCRVREQETHRWMRAAGLAGESK